jgi:hypothetical protein
MLTNGDVCGIRKIRIMPHITICLSFMKKHYLIVLLACWLTAFTASAQSPDVPSRRKSTESLWGVGVQIPLTKLFGRKKTKNLPKQPRSAADSQYLHSATSDKPIVYFSDKLGTPSDSLSKLSPIDSTESSNYDEGNRQCFVAVRVRRYSDGTETWTPLYSWCIGGGVTSDSPADEYGEGGSGADPIIVETIEISPPTERPTIEDVDCNAYSKFFQKSVAEEREQGGLLTADGKLITLPSNGNTVDRTLWTNNYEDAAGNRTVRFQQKPDGTWEVVLFDADGQPTYVGQVIGMVHTHPSLIGYNPSHPSLADLYVGSNYPGLQQFANTENGSFLFDEFGNIIPSHSPFGATLPNCPF